MSKFKFSNVIYSNEKQEWEHNLVSDEVKSVQQLVIPKGTLELENYACYGCESLASIHIPHTVSKIGLAAFANCGIQEINIPSLVTSLPNDAFYNCNKLETITISSTLKEVGTTALLNCTSLKTIYVACDNYKDYDSYVKLIKNEFIHSKCKWKYLYASKTFFSTFNFTTIQNYKECACLVVPRGITRLESCKDALKLEKIEGIDDVELGEGAFENCCKLEKIELSVDIPKECFKNCTSLSHIVLHSDSKLTVGESAFEGCINLLNIEFNGDVKGNESESEKSEPQSKSEPQAKKFAIGSKAFKNCQGIINLDLSQISSLQESSFESCYSLSTITLPAISYIPKSCFKACFNLSHITFPDAIRKISESAFEHCYKLSSIDLKFVKVLEPKAFKECFFLQSLASSELKIVAESAFEKCISLKSINLKDLNKIKSKAFEWCINLESVNVSNIKSIEKNAFAHCLKLKEATICGNIAKIDQSQVFVDNPELKNVKLIENFEISKDKECEISPELQEIMNKIEENKKILERLHEQIDYSKYSTNSPRFILSIQQKLINNKMKLIETKDEEMKILKEANKNNLEDVHDRVSSIQEKLGAAMKEYKSNVQKIGELVESETSEGNEDYEY